MEDAPGWDAAGCGVAGHRWARIRLGYFCMLGRSHTFVCPTADLYPLQQHWHTAPWPRTPDTPQDHASPSKHEHS